MFGTRQICEETLSEVKTVRRRLDELTERTSAPAPLSVAEFIEQVDHNVDTEKFHVNRVATGAVLNTAKKLLKEMSPVARQAMLRHWLS